MIDLVLSGRQALSRSIYFLNGDPLKHAVHLHLHSTKVLPVHYRMSIFHGEVTTYCARVCIECRDLRSGILRESSNKSTAPTHVKRYSFFGNSCYTFAKCHLQKIHHPQAAMCSPYHHLTLAAGLRVGRARKHKNRR